MSDAAPSLAQIAVPGPLPEPLGYAIPAPLAGRIAPGVRVRVPLGRRRVVGVVTALGGELPEGVEAREIVACLDDPEHPALPRDLLATVLFGAHHYLAPPGEMVRAALPAALAPRARRWVAITEAGRDRAALAIAPIALRWLAARPRGRVLERTLLGRCSAGDLRALVGEGLVAIEVDEDTSRGAAATRRILRPTEVAARDPEAALARLARAPAQARALRAALGGEPRTAAELSRVARASTKAIAALVDAGALVAETEERPVPPPPAPDFPATRPETLTEAQRAAVERVTSLIDDRAYRAVLVHGITGSGKTEVYLRSAEHVLAAGRGALFLVPEIGLTPHLAHALAARFGEDIALLHSGLNDRQREDAWQRVRRGETRIVVGARSALFAPLDRPGLIVVDEEHDSGYKQDEGARYHARDMAIVRAREAGAVILLGSATPSLEAWSLARDGKADLIELPDRVGDAALATVELVDMRSEFRAVGEDRPLSRRLREALEETVSRGDQAMILLNRRGQTRVLHCRACGEAVSCPACSISLTWHRVGQRMRCHYCGHQRARPSRCPGCESPYLADVGYGTQLAEEAVREVLPEARVARLDRDVVRSGQRLADLLGGFARGEIDVLVGTQMIAKGHHFPRVTLVGVLSADASLGMPDFRAGERTFQLLTQVAGRAGRGRSPGRVVVQAYRSDHHALQAAMAQDYQAFVERELPSRELMHYPPAAALANLIVRDREQSVAFQKARDLARALEEAGEGRIVVLGPTTAPLARLRELYRVQLMVRAQRRGRVADALRRAVEPLRDPTGALPRWLLVDVDPHHLL